MNGINLKDTIKEKESQVGDMFIGLINASPIIKDFVDSLSVEQIIALEIPADIQDKINKGIYTITTKKGVLRAVVREAETGEIVKHLDLKYKDLPHDFNLVEASQYAQMANITAKLQELADEIKYIQQGIDNVLIGMQNDRIAQYLSGEDLYIKARLIVNPELRNQLISQSLMRLNNAYFQLSEEVKREIRFLLQNYDKDKLKIENIKTKELTKKIQNINCCFDVLLKAAQGQAAIYYECGETQAMLHSLETYGKLLEDLLTEETTEMLYQFDKTDKKIAGGTWYYKSKELPAIIKETGRQYLLKDNSSFIIKKSDNGEVNYVGLHQLPQAAK